MHTYQKAAVVMAMLGSVSFLGAGVSHADGEKVKLDNKQSQECSADEANVTTNTLDRLVDRASVAGTQINDNSERTSVNCTQVFVIGR